MSIFAVAADVKSVVRKTLGWDSVLQVASEVNDYLASRREYTVDVDAVLTGLSEYLIERIGDELDGLLGVHNPGATEWFVAQEYHEPTLLWDTFIEEVGWTLAVSKLYGMVSEFPEICAFSSVCGILVYEFADNNVDSLDSHLNPERVHGLQMAV